MIQNRVFDFLKTVVLNLKSHPDNHGGLFLVLITTQHSS
jgi:hypothetical protein